MGWRVTSWGLFLLAQQFRFCNPMSPIVTETWLAGEGLSKVAGRTPMESGWGKCAFYAGLRGLQARLDDDVVCWNRLGNAELVPEGREDGG